LIATIIGFANGMASGRSPIMLQDIRRLAWVAQHTDIHRQDPPALAPDRRGRIYEFILFCVKGADQLNFLAAHGSLLEFDPSRLEI
jgi:hypothetical protein